MRIQVKKVSSLIKAEKTLMNKIRVREGKMKEIYPKNKEHFKKLIPFAQKIMSIFKNNKINFVVYGSFSHSYHTKDENMEVHDIDIMIKNSDFIRVTKLLEKNKIKFKYYPEWETCIIKKGKLKVEIDSVGLGYKTIKEKTIFKTSPDADFYGVKIKILSLKDLCEMYPIAYNRSKDDKAKILKKIKHMEGFLGRKLI